VRFQREHKKLRGFVVLGSNGEFPFMTINERRQVLQCAVEAVSADSSSSETYLIAGTGSNCIQETIELTESAAKMGYNAALVVTPYYYKSILNDDVLIHHFTSIASRSPIPVILYNVPNFTAVDLSISAIRKLSRHINIVGIKESSGQIVKIAQLVQLGKEIEEETHRFFGIFAGSGSYLLPSLSLGVTGGIMALANVLPEQCMHLVELFESKKLDEARDLQVSLMAVNQAITKTYGIAGMKVAMERYFHVLQW